MAESAAPPAPVPDPAPAAAPAPPASTPLPSASSSAPSSASSLAASPAQSPFDHPASDAARAAQAASRWNGLLRWARGVRLGGQGGAPAGWDFGTGMYHVPRDSPEWTAGVERAPVDPSRPPPPLTLQTTGTLSHLNPDAALSDDDGAGGGGAGAGGGGLTESGRPRRRAVR
ncbi:hypothetical protein JCM10449v2_003434 [Rhodotorula kratochvilovae]